jgi:putative aldouronate transport system permease protein
MEIKSNKRWSHAGHILMIILSISAIAPFILLIIASFTDEGAALRNGYSYVPEAFSLEAYRYIATQWRMIGGGYLVSFIVTIIGTAVGVTISAMLGYVLSQRELPFRSVILFLLTFTMLFNGGLTATYIVYTQIFHIKNTIFGLIVPGLLMNAYNVMMFRNYFEMSIPGALVEASKIDGATEAKIFFKVIVPLSLPMVATVGLMVALMYWNDWMNGMYYLSSNSKIQSIQTILNRVNENIKFLQQNNLGVAVNESDLPTKTVRMAIALVGTVPILSLYPIFQKWFVKGMMVGAVKE